MLGGAQLAHGHQDLGGRAGRRPPCPSHPPWHQCLPHPLPSPLGNTQRTGNVTHEGARHKAPWSTFEEPRPSAGCRWQQPGLFCHCAVPTRARCRGEGALLPTRPRHPDRHLAQAACKEDLGGEGAGRARIWPLEDSEQKCKILLFGLPCLPIISHVL